jgi:hypothetical protein
MNGARHMQKEDRDSNNILAKKLKARSFSVDLRIYRNEIL